MTAACATGMAAANTPATNLASMMSGIVVEAAITVEERAAPVRQTLSVLRRPNFGLDESCTMRGHMTIWAMEKALVDMPTCTGEAPMDCKCSGSVDNAMLSETIRASTVSSMGVTVDGSLSSPSAYGFEWSTLLADAYKAR